MLYICLRDGSARLVSNMKGVPCHLAILPDDVDVPACHVLILIGGCLYTYSL